MKLFPLDNNHKIITNETQISIFKSLMQQSAATLCQSIYTNHSYDCGFRCNSPTILLRTLQAPLVNGQALITLNHNLGIIISFKGSKSAYDYYMDAQFHKSHPKIWPVNSTILVHSGFLKVYTQLRLELLQYLKELKSNHDLYFTGHSLGGVLATMAAIDTKLQLQLNPQVVTFGQPRIGNYAFSNWLNALNISIKRIQVYGDLVPFLPPEWNGYKHNKQPYLIRNNETFECLDECDNEYKLDFKLHETGYYGWNTTIMDC